MYKQDIDVVVIGAGAAGMMAAAVAGQRGRGVVLIDHSQRLAEKIRISGGGRCNFTNAKARPECYLSNNPHFCKSALAQYTAADFIELVERYQIAWHEKKLGQLFCDNSSQEIIDLLKSECDLGQVIWRLNTQVLGVERADKGFIVRTSRETWYCQSVVIATGGLSIPAIGATGFGYELAKQFGLTITPLAPALVPLTFDIHDLYAELAGVSIECSARAARGPAFDEAILLTHKGVSGPAILQISSYWHAGEEIEIDLLPNEDVAQILEQEKRSDTLLSNVMSHYLPKRFANAFCASVLPIKPMKQYTPNELALLADRVHHWRIVPSGSQGYKKAEVTRGGVDTQALSSKTMEAKQVPGLFFVGEVVDVTGWLGGYNFQWAWSSAWVAGQSV